MPLRRVKGQVDGLPGKDPVRIFDGWIGLFEQIQVLCDKGSGRKIVSVDDHPAQDIPPLDPVSFGFQSAGNGHGLLSGRDRCPDP